MAKTRHTFSRHVAPFAPVALALLMNANPKTTGKPGPTSGGGGGGATFTPVCTLPFNGAATTFDGKCGIQGGSSDPGKQAESKSKNNFCVMTNSPQAVTHQDLVDLQTKASGSNLPKNLPDRSQVEGMGEGKYVSYVAVIKDAHYSDVAAGEAVNCNIPGNDTNDIHIVLMADPTDTDECHSTTAEMSPHYRPASWTPENLKGLGSRPVRVRGHLFYDGSHVPCSGTSRPNPKRISLWEIHPVYSMDVCNVDHGASPGTVADCQNASEADWVPLEKWLSSEQQ